MNYYELVDSNKIRFDYQQASEICQEIENVFSKLTFSEIDFKQTENKCDNHYSKEYPSYIFKIYDNIDIAKKIVLDFISNEIMKLEINGYVELGNMFIGINYDNEYMYEVKMGYNIK